MTTIKYAKTPATAADFDQRPRPEWATAPWAGRPPIELHVWRPVPPCPATIYEICAFARDTIKPAHDAGWHREAFNLGDRLYEIGYQPTPEAVAAVQSCAKFLADRLAKA
jgi:hypothetical protein